MLTEPELRMLGLQHELGAHTLTHPRLTRMLPEDVREELSASREWVERVSGKPCTMFCYPYGDQNAKVRELAEQAGFTAARGTRTLQFSVDERFDMPVSLQIYPFPWRKKGDLFQKITDPVPHLRLHAKRLRELHVPWHARRGWLPLAKNLFTHALNSQKTFFHLFGHSHELELYGMWHDLERFLAFVAEHRSQIRPVPNSALSG